MSKSFVWKYFERRGGKAHCKVKDCNAAFSLSSTSSMFYHHNHKISRPSNTNLAGTQGAGTHATGSHVTESHVTESNATESRVTQRTIVDCFSRETLESTLARMVAQDGLAIRQITRSTFLRQALAKEFPKRAIPKNENSMMALVESFFNQVKAETKQKITRLKSDGVKFSATADEGDKSQEYPIFEY